MGHRLRRLWRSHHEPAVAAAITAAAVATAVAATTLAATVAPAALAATLAAISSAWWSHEQHLWWIGTVQHLGKYSRELWCHWGLPWTEFRERVAYDCRHAVYWRCVGRDWVSNRRKLQLVWRSRWKLQHSNTGRRTRIRFRFGASTHGKVCGVLAFPSILCWSLVHGYERLSILGRHHADPEDGSFGQQLENNHIASIRNHHD